MNQCPFRPPTSKPTAVPNSPSPQKRLPGPKGLPFIGNLLDYQRNPTRFLLHLAKQYGDINSFTLGSNTIYQISRPDLIEQILVRDFSKYEKTGATARAKCVLGRGLITSEGDFHKKQKRLAQPAFSASFLNEYGRAMPPLIRRRLSHWNEGQIRDISSDMMRMTFLIAGKTLLGADLERDSKQFGTDLTVIFKRINQSIYPFSSLLHKLPVPSTIRYWKAIKRIDRVVWKLMDQKEKEERGQKNLLSVYLSFLKMNDPKNHLDRRQVRDEAVTFLAAGHETVATALTWTCYLLARHPEISDRIVDEVRRVCGDHDPSVENIPDLLYTERVFKEALRLYPPVWNLTRQVKEKTIVGGAALPAGSIVSMSPFVVHRDPRFFKNPHAFNPDRWHPTEVEKRPAYSYFPFGGGPRGCIGAGFAMMEAKLIIATMVRDWKMNLVPNQKIDLLPMITLRPRYGINMVLEKRSVKEKVRRIKKEISHS